MGIHQGNGDLSLGKGLIQQGEVADDEGKKAETQTGFDGRQYFPERGVWNDIAQSEGKEGGPAHINVCAEIGGSLW